MDGNGFEEEDIIRDIKGCDAMIVRTAKITGRIIAAADRLKVIARHGAGYDGIDQRSSLFFLISICSRNNQKKKGNVSRRSM